MVEFLIGHVRQGGVGVRGTCVVDEWNNVLIRKGDAAICPCVAAHIDTVHPLHAVRIIEQDGIVFGMDKHGHRAGIGADDKAGVFICLELLERFDNIALTLFGSEEIGCVGTGHAPESWFHDVGYVIEFDCPGRGLVSYTSGGTQLFAPDGEFIRTAKPLLIKHALTCWEDHPFSDVKALRQRFDVSCLNISCGYHRWHLPDEFLVLTEVEAALAAGHCLIRTLGNRNYPFHAGTPESAEPPSEITV
jgi:putative aminopeptidase FrvX